MRLSTIAKLAGVFLAAGAVSVVTAYFSARLIEDSSLIGVETALETEGMGWAKADTDGLRVYLIGEAPDEATRFQAITVAGRVVDASRVIDQMEVAEAEDIAPPRFSIEILRNDAGVQLIGLVPASTDREALTERLGSLTRGGEVTDLLEAADFPVPDGWEDALEFAGDALRDLPRSKVSVAAGHVAIKAMAESGENKQRLENDLVRRKPDDVRLALDISAPRPVISPFVLSFTLDENGPRFDACSAPDEAARDQILRAAAQAGLEGKATCTIGLGVPSKRWPDAVQLSIAKVAEMGGGTVTFNNADIALTAPQGTSPAVFDRIVGEMETGLPEVFALKAVLPKTPDPADEGPPEFTATLSPEGTVQLRGRLNSEVSRQIADSFAKARFGSGIVYTAARVDDTLPAGWQVRALAGIEILAGLVKGSVTVTPDAVRVVGETGNQTANADIAALVVEKLGETTELDLNVTYNKRHDASLGLPSPQECVEGIVEIIGARKITFEPGSTTLDAATQGILNEVAELLVKCEDIPLEIGGHTDSQGREAMNQQLSQERAQAVLDALTERRVPTSTYSVKGYGEEQPIADNETEAGREANRRIEFKLVEDS